MKYSNFLIFCQNRNSGPLYTKKNFPKKSKKFFIFAEIEIFIYFFYLFFFLKFTFKQKSIKYFNIDLKQKYLRNSFIYLSKTHRLVFCHFRIIFLMFNQALFIRLQDYFYIVCNLIFLLFLPSRKISISFTMLTLVFLFFLFFRCVLYI